MNETTTNNKAIKQLDFLANHFEPRDWDYTRQTKLKSIRYISEYDPANKISSRIKQAFIWLFAPPTFFRKLHTKPLSQLAWRFRMFAYSFKREANLPDGHLDGGSILTFWEETGEYLSLVQPTVGALLANFLKEEPEHPHAQLITAEIERLYERLYDRISNGEVYESDS